LVLAGILALGVVGSAGADVENGNLPGGTSIQVSIDVPVDGAVVPQVMPPAGPLMLSGTASVGQGITVANTLLIYVVDASFSTSDGAGGTACGNQNPNYDDDSNTVLDCEIAAAKALNAQAIANGTVAEIALVVFGENAARADLAPAPAAQAVIAPNADANGNAAPDFDEAISSIFLDNASSGDGIDKFTRLIVRNSTNYGDALVQVAQVAGSSTRPSKQVVFLSDGEPTIGDSVATTFSANPSLAHLRIDTFAVGSGNSCGAVDGSGNSRGTLAQISDRAASGTCTNVTDPNNLPSVVPGVIASTLLGVDVNFDGFPFNPLPNSVLDPDLPATGPASTAVSIPFGGPVGTHTICLRARGSDGGGTGSAEDCHTFTINGRPVVTANGGSGLEGSPIGVGGTVTDTDSTPTTTWSYVPVSGVDGGATCAFADPSAVSTTVTCTDDGVYNVTLTADDGINAPVAASADLTIGNDPPEVSIVSPTAGTHAGAITLDAQHTDAGANDTHTCDVTWGDGDTGSDCTDTHTYSAGTYTLEVTVTDDDGGSDTESVTFTINSPPDCSDLTATPSRLWAPNNRWVTIGIAGATDADGDALTYQVVSVLQDEPLAGSADARMLGTGALQLRAQRRGTADGRVYTVTMLVSDGSGGCLGSVHVSVPHSVHSTAVDSGAAFNSFGT
jgi:hypothetical protein